MSSRTVTVEMCDRDPNNLQQACEEWCREHLDDVSHLNADDAAESLRRGYLATIDDRTTGADALAVSVID